MTVLESSAETLLDDAQQLLAGQTGFSQGVAERAAALMARQALEMRIAERLEPYGVDVNGTPFTTQLLCLQGTMSDKDLARQAASLWASLSTIVHHLGYEISPTGDELTALLRRTARIVGEM